MLIIFKPNFKTLVHPPVHPHRRPVRGSSRRDIPRATASQPFVDVAYKHRLISLSCPKRCETVNRDPAPPH